MTISISYLKERYPIWLEPLEKPVPSSLVASVIKGSNYGDEKLTFTFSLGRNLSAFQLHQPLSAQVLCRKDFLVLRAISSVLSPFPRQSASARYSVDYFVGSEETGFVAVLNASDVTRRSQGNDGYGLSSCLPEQLVEAWLWDTMSWHVPSEPFAAMGIFDPRCFIRHWDTPWPSISNVPGIRNASDIVLIDLESGLGRLELPSGLTLNDARLVMDSCEYGKEDLPSFQIILDAKDSTEQLYIIRDRDLKTFEKFDSAVSRIDRFCAGVLMGEDTTKLAEAL